MEILLELDIDFVIKVTFLMLCLVLSYQVESECYFVSNQVFNCEIEMNESVATFQILHTADLEDNCAC